MSGCVAEGAGEPLAAIPDALERQARRLLRRAVERDVSIVTAESCTGGLLAALLTDIEGASRALERGFVVYSAEAKCELLGIEAAMIDDCGTVSRDVAVAMARGALAHSHGDIAAAITGFAGPGAPGDEAGLVHLAAVARDGRIAHRELHLGDVGRGPVRERSLAVALDLLDEVLD